MNQFAVSLRFLFSLKRYYQFQNIKIYKQNPSVIHFSQLTMDYEDIIKLEEQSPAYSTGNNSPVLKQYMATFYDNDSQLFKRDLCEQFHVSENISFEQAIDYIQNYVDIIDTPLDDILLCFDRLQYGQDLDKRILKKKLLKRKFLLKRYRAKNRQPKSLFTYQQIPETNTQNVLETEAEIKKKRNRVSAQISRDRKKQYFKELEMKNLKLEEEIIRTRLENEKLKKQMEITETTKKSKNHSEIFNNKLTKLLIFLGIIYLFGMLKETFASTSESLSKFKSVQRMEDMSRFSSLNQGKMMEEGQRRVMQFLQDEQMEDMLVGSQQKKPDSGCQFPLPGRNMEKRQLFSGLIDKLSELKTGIEKNFD